MIKLEELAVLWRKLGLDLTSRRYRQIADEGLVDQPVNRGYVNPLKVLVQLVIYYQKMADGKGDSSHEEVKKLRDLEKLEMERMERKKMEGTLIARAEVVDEFVKRIHVIKSDLLALPKRIARWPEAAEVVKKQVNSMLKTYSRKTGALSE